MPVKTLSIQLYTYPYIFTIYKDPGNNSVHCYYQVYLESVQHDKSLYTEDIIIDNQISSK